MAIRLSGLTSGLDTESIVSELVSAYSLKTEKYTKEQTKLDWKRDAWSSLNTKIYSLYTSVGNLRYSSAYSLKKATISDGTKATVSASSDAVNITQKLNIISTAQSSYITGGQLKTGATEDSTLADLGYKGGNSTINLLDAEGNATSIDVTSTTTVSSFVTKLKEAGVNASYDSSTNRIFVNAKKAGADNDFTLVGADSNGQAALKALGLNVALTTTDEDGNTTFSDAGAVYSKYYQYYKAGYTAEDGTEVSALQATNDYIQSLVDAYKTAKSNWDQMNAKIALTKNAISEKQDEIEEAETQQTAYSKVSEFLAANDTDGSWTMTDLNNLSQADIEALGYTEEEATEIRGYIDTVVPQAPEEVAEVAEGEEGYEEYQAYLTEKADYDAAMAESATTYVTDGLSEVETNLSTLNTELDDLNTDLETYKEAFDGYADEMEASEFADYASMNDTLMTAEVMNLAQSAVQAAEMLESGDYDEGSATKITGTDAHIILNGVDYYNTSNSFTVNGLSITATGVTGEAEEDAITVTVDTDSQGIYDKVKDFLTQYNAIINEMCKLYNADSASDYEPLTDDEKDAMSETEIEKWETKIKDALLRKDTTLGSLLTAMTSAMSTSYEIDGQSYALSSFGIKTLGYFTAAENENYAYHIDGDEDDENTSGNTDKLLEAINNDPDTVISFLKQMASGLYTAIDNKMKGTTLSSTYKVYNDKEMDSLYNNYTTIISDWEDKVSDKEDYYYDKFTQMETALSKLESQSSSLSGLLG